VEIHSAQPAQFAGCCCLLVLLLLLSRVLQSGDDVHTYPATVAAAAAAGLDQVLLLSSPKFSSSQPDLLRSVVARARLLRKQLDTIGLRVQGIQVRQWETNVLGSTCRFVLVQQPA
jgi:hypothetical protein